MGLDIQLDPEHFEGAEGAMVVSMPWSGIMAFHIPIKDIERDMVYHAIAYPDVRRISDFVDFIIDSIIWEEILAAVFKLEGYEVGLQLDYLQIYNLEVNDLFMERQTLV